MMYELYGRCMMYDHTALYGLYGVQERETMCGSCMGAKAVLEYEALYSMGMLGYVPRPV